MSTPLVSIIIPTYNRPELLERACNTAFQQSYENIEIIVVDDNSPTDYSEVLRVLEPLNIKYTKRSANGGGSAARNTGIEIAKGEFIAFLDDDDLWHEQKIEKQIATLSESVRASHCGYILNSSGSKRVEKKSLITLSDLCENNKLASTTGLLCSAEILKRTRFDESLNRAQDWDLYLRIAKETDFAYVQEALYTYDDGDHERMSNRFAQLSIAEYKAKLGMLKKHKEILNKDAYEYHVAELILPSLKKRNDKFSVLKLCIEEIGIFKTLYYLNQLSFASLQKRNLLRS
ncbi:hypothetical protein KUL118_28420 [Tenacibaculum sp. KUL118]|nr:hypothetical protein KUL118_28420 [Tenacibaculum sp. KUL118]